MSCFPCNAFPEHTRIDNDAVIRIGKIKTISFILIFISSVVIATIYYVSEEQFTQVTISNPTQDEYNNIKSFRPDCECNLQSINVGNFVTVNKSYEAFCTQANLKYTSCSRDTSSLSEEQSQMVQVCKESQAFSYLQGILGLCQTSINVHTAAQQNFLSSSITSSYLISESSMLEHRIDVLDNQNQNTVSMILLSSKSMIENFAALDRPLLLSTDDVPSNIGLVELQPDGTTTYNVSKWNTTIECECGDSWACSFTLGDQVTRTCSLFETIMNAPITVWQTQGWWKNGLGIDLTAYPNVSESTIFSTDGFVFETSSSYTSDQTFQSVFRNGFVQYRNITVSFDDYYAQCAPTTCIYYENSKRSLIDVLSVLAGLVGGLTVGIKVFLKLLCARKVKQEINGTDKIRTIEVSQARSSKSVPIDFALRD